MQKFLKPTRKNVRRALLTQKLIGKWHGKNSDPMFGETVQEFEWLDAKKVKVMIIGQKLECTYKIRTDLDSIDGGWRMDIIVPQQPFVPYIFRLEEDGTMSMVAPQVDPNMGFATPTTFAEGTPGLINLSPGEPPVNLDVHTMSRDEKILDAIEQLSTSFTAKLPQQQQLSEMEQMMQGLQVMQIMSVKIQNKYGTDIFQAAEKITENPDLAGTNVQLREAATKLKATITKVQKIMGQTTPGANPAVHNTPSNTDNTASKKSDSDAPVASVEVADDDVLAEAADSVIADFEKFSANDKSEESVATPADAIEVDPKQDNEVTPPTQASASSSSVAEEPVVPAKTQAADNTKPSAKSVAATQRQRSRMVSIELVHEVDRGAIVCCFCTDVVLC